MSDLVVLVEAAPDDNEHVNFAVVAGQTVVMMGGCARKDMGLQAALVPGSEVIEIAPTQRQAPGLYRVDRSGEKPRLVEV